MLLALASGAIFLFSFVLRLFLLLQKLPSVVKMEAPAPVGDTEAHTAEPVLFPHIYGPITPDCVRELTINRNDDDGEFTFVVGV